MITDEISIPTTEIEADGFITRQQDLERVAMSKARPASKCPCPHCEDCRSMEKRLTELENLVADKILGSKEHKPDEETNMTWADYFNEESK